MLQIIHVVDTMLAYTFSCMVHTLYSIAYLNPANLVARGPWNEVSTLEWSILDHAVVAAAIHQ